MSWRKGSLVALVQDGIYFRPFDRRVAGWDRTYPPSVMHGSAEFERVVQRCAADLEERSRIG
jgi:hypothetical protein